MAANPRVFFGMAVGGAPACRIVMELFTDVTSCTTENFRTLCTVRKAIMCQGGDFSTRNDKGGESIYDSKFADENFIKKHTGLRIGKIPSPS